MSVLKEPVVDNFATPKQPYCGGQTGTRWKGDAAIGANFLPIVERDNNKAVELELGAPAGTLHMQRESLIGRPTKRR